MVDQQWKPLAEEMTPDVLPQPPTAAPADTAAAHGQQTVARSRRRTRTTSGRRGLSTPARGL
jgi:hypothetical protein